MLYNGPDFCAQKMIFVAFHLFLGGHIWNYVHFKFCETFKSISQSGAQVVWMIQLPHQDSI